jgi:hypothetical protein
MSEVETNHNEWQHFHTFKQRGEWVELEFMAQAALHGFNVSKPWGDCSAYDVGVEHGSDFLRVQVKSTTVRTGTGYFCQFKPNYYKQHDYTLDEIDLFAAYVIPVAVWYLIPAIVILKPKRKVGLMLHPVDKLKKNRYKYEHYRGAWHLLNKTREELSDRNRERPVKRFVKGHAFQKTAKTYP